MGQFSVFRFGDFVLDGSERRLLRSGEDVYLPPKTFELLLHLLQNRGRVLTKDELLEAVWPDVNVVENTLAQRIREIREALGDGAHGGRFIKTVPRVGYQFIAELDDAPAGVGAQPLAIAIPEPAGTVAIGGRRAAETDVPVRKQHQLKLPVAIVCVMLVGLIGVGYYLARIRPAPPPTSPAAITSIAVLPFKPLVAEGHDASLELGMADSLIMKLGNLRPDYCAPPQRGAPLHGRRAGRSEGWSGTPGRFSTGGAHPEAAESDQGERKSASSPRWTAAVGRSVR